MPAILCPKHDRQIALHFCPHALAAVDARQPIAVYLHRGPYAWHTLCDACVRNVPDSLEEADKLACSECIMEWVRATGSDYQQRANNPTNEYPPGYKP